MQTDDRPLGKLRSTMPYVACPHCALITYTAACWLGADHCARCDAELPRVRRFARAHEAPAPAVASPVAPFAQRVSG